MQQIEKIGYVPIFKINEAYGGGYIEVDGKAIIKDKKAMVGDINEEARKRYSEAVLAFQEATNDLFTGVVHKPTTFIEDVSLALSAARQGYKQEMHPELKLAIQHIQKCIEIVKGTDKVWRE